MRDVRPKHNKPTTCEGCPLHTTGLGFVPDKAVDAPALILLGEAPGRTEVAQGEPFVGQAGWTLKNWGLKAVPELQYLVDGQRVYFGNTLRCLPPATNLRHYPTGEERSAAELHCRRYDDWGNTLSPVILLGEIPQRYWFHEELADEDRRDRKGGRDVKGVFGRVGRVCLREGRKWIFAPHPSAILRDPRLVENLQISLRIAYVESQNRPMAPRLAVPVVRSAEQVEHILSNYQGGIGLDLEWGNDGKISIFGFAWNNGRRAGAFSRTEQTGETVRRILERVTTDTTKGAFLVTHNGTSADLPKLQEEGIILGTRLRNASSASSEESAGGVFDTMLGLHATHAHLAGTGSYDLRSLVLLYGHSGRDSGNWFPLDWKRYDEDIWETCALDAAAALYCAKPLREAIERDGLGETSAISHRVAPIFERMGRRGVRLDMQVLEQIHKHRELERERLIASLPTITKRKEYKRREPREWTEPVNPRSDAVIGYFESTWGYTLRGRTRADFQRASADSRCPAEARKVAEICAALSQAGSDTTWIGDTEDDGLTFSKVKDGFVFPQYNVVGTPDRPSCTGTNIQNFPRPGEDPRPVPLRAAVIPPESGMVLISVDYQAVETYTNAVEAGDWEMVKAIQEGRRGHQQTADFINTTFGLALTRQQGKTVNHSLDKGESAGNLAVRLWGNRTRANLGRAQGILDALLQPYPATQAFRAQLRKGAGENNPLVVVNRFGRRLMCFARSKYAAGEEQEYGRNREEQAARERWKGALAFLGRSCAVDCLLRVMSKVFEEARLDAFSLPYIEIHDELVYAVPKEGAARCAGILKETFEEPIPELDNLSIPCEVKVAGNWADCK